MADSAPKRTGKCPFHRSAAPAEADTATPATTAAKTCPVAHSPSTNGTTNGSTKTGKCPVAHGTAASKSGGKCPVAHGATNGSAASATNGHAATATATPRGKCPVAHGAAAATKQSSGKCPAGYGNSLASLDSADSKPRCPFSRKNSQDVDVHASDAPTTAAEAVKTYFKANYNEVALNGYTKPGKARVELSTIMAQKTGYTDDDLEAAGDDVTLMQGVGYPHQFANYRKGDTVIDLGCGMGVDTRIAARRVGPTGHAYGIDLSEGEIMVALSRASKLELRNVDFRIADMEKLPFNNASADVVISNGGFCLVPNKQQAFQEVWRVLRPGGRIAISCTIRRQLLNEGERWPVCMNTFMLQSDIEPVLSAIGFAGIRVDMSDAAMDAHQFTDDDIDAAAKAADVEASVIRTQLKLRAQRSHPDVSDKTKASGVSAGAGAGAGAGVGVTAAAKDAPAEEADDDVSRRHAVHKNSSAFAHLAKYNMNDLCARVVIIAHKPGAVEAAAHTVVDAALGAATAVSTGDIVVGKTPAGRRTRLAFISVAALGIVAAAKYIKT